jgi:hypothetical protein
MTADTLSENLEIHDVRQGSLVNDERAVKKSEITFETLRKISRVHVLLKSSRTSELQYPICLAEVRHELAFR